MIFEKICIHLHMKFNLNDIDKILYDNDVLVVKPYRQTGRLSQQEY